jgi:hypothetical protein
MRKEEKRIEFLIIDNKLEVFNKVYKEALNN